MPVIFRIKTTFRRLAKDDTGKIIFQRYGKSKEKHLVFSPIPPRDSGIKCDSCGLSVWNATNFSCDIHFCPDRELDVEITDYNSYLRLQK